jgi:hypothetical protein
MNLQALIDATIAKLNATESNKFGYKEVYVEEGNVRCSMTVRRDRWGSSKTTIQFKRDGKVVSKATLMGKERQEVNETLRSSFEAQAPEIAADFEAQFRRTYAYQLEKWEGKIPAYPAAGHPSYMVIRGMLAPVCDVMVGKSLQLNEAKLKKVANDAADKAAVEWFYKTNEKLGAIDNPTLVRDQGGNVIIEGERAGKKVRMVQQRILKSSPLGRLFNQFPARIYVDGQFVTEAAYKGMFK